MSEIENQQIEAIDINNGASDVAHTLLSIARTAIDFADIERVPRYYEHRRENNAEHSLMLGLAAMEIGARYYPGLDTGLMTQFALVHDLVELETNDVPTFSASEEMLAAKHMAEQAALDKLSKTLPPHVADMLVWYEEQADPESRLVRHIDKLLPYAVDIHGPGQQVMREDYGVTNRSQFVDANTKLEERFHRMFPENAHAVIHLAHGVLAEMFTMQLNES